MSLLYMNSYFHFQYSLIMKSNKSKLFGCLVHILTIDRIVLTNDNYAIVIIRKQQTIRRTISPCVHVSEPSTDSSFNNVPVFFNDA